MKTFIQPIGWIELRILDKNGILEKIFHKPIDSLLRQYVDQRQIQFSNVTAQIRDFSNVLRNVSPTSKWNANGPAGAQVMGIEVGTGTNAVTISDYKLQTSIAHGNGAGQLFYQACTIGPTQVVGNQAFFTISRNFNNNTPATITVQEIGLYAQDLNNYGYLIARDITGAIDVLTTKTLAAQYTFIVTV